MLSCGSSRLLTGYVKVHEIIFDLVYCSDAQLHRAAERFPWTKEGRGVTVLVRLRFK